MDDPSDQPLLEARELTLAYGDFVVQRDLSFAVRRGDVFVVMGESGCGKSTVLRCLVGLHAPASGAVLHGGRDYWSADPSEQERERRRFGVLFQGGALWSSMTLAENVALPLGQFTELAPAEVREIVALKLALVGLAGAEERFPAELSGGMRKRAGLARALALDPEVLFLDEPSAGLDPLTSRRLDELILELRDGLGATFVVVSHELASIFAIADDALFLDTEQRTAIAQGDPRVLRDRSDVPKVRAFLQREEVAPAVPTAGGEARG